MPQICTSCRQESGSFGLGAFTVPVSGMPLNQTVYFRAFATNTQGPGFSDQSSIATTPVSLMHSVVE